MSLKDIAAEVGVSISTVSRVLNSDAPSAARKELQRQIWDAARRQGYVPNKTARALKHQEFHQAAPSKILYCMFACPDQETKDDPFFTKLTSVIEREAFKNNYILHYTFSSSDLDSPVLLRTFSSNPSNALIILGRFDMELYRRVHQHFKKIVYVGLNRLDVPCDQVVCDGYKASEAAVEYLYSMGHRKIAYIGSSEARLQGFLDTVNRLHLPVSEEEIISDICLSMEGGYQGGTRLTKQSHNVTGVFCGNDITAIGALRAFQEAGLRVPEDISLIGINDLENVQYTSPMLSSVHVPLEEMGRTAVHVLLDRIDNAHTCPIVVEFPCAVVKRESTTLAETVGR